MGRGLGFKPLIVILSLISSIAFAASEDPEKGWTETETDMSLIRLFTNTVYPCAKSEANFLACVQMLNGLGGNTVPKYSFIPADMIAKTPGMKAEVVGNLSSALVMARIDSWGKNPATSRELAEQLKTREAALRVASAATFKEAPDVNFELIAMELLKEKDPKVSLQRAIGTAVNQLILVHDGHGHLEPLRYFAEKMKNADQKFFGVGIVMESIAKKTVVVGLVEGSPAEKVGIKAKDEILKVDGTSTDGLLLDEVKGRIRGADKTPVTLTVSRNGEVLVIPIAREEIVVPNVTPTERSDLGAKILHIQIKQFDEKACDKVRDALNNIEPETTGVILDLRNNPGGLLEQAVCIGGLFVGPQKIVSEHFLDTGNIKPYVSDETKLTDLPLAVMINEGSASASEIVAGAMQDYQRGLIVGTRSYGKATVQLVGQYDLVPDLMLAKTIARFYTPNDRTNQIVGIQPDIEVTAKPNMTEEEKFSLREAELVPSALPPAGTAWTQPRTPVLEQVKNTCFTGRSEALLSKLDSLNADYQLLKAEELLNCSAGVAAAVIPAKSKQASAGGAATAAN